MEIWNEVPVFSRMHVKSAQSPRQCRLSQGSVPVKITPEPRASEPQAQKLCVRDCKPSLLCWENNDLYLKFIYHYTEHTFLAAIKRLYYDIWVAPAQQKTLGTRSFHNESADPSIATDWPAQRSTTIDTCPTFHESGLIIFYRCHFRNISQDMGEKMRSFHLPVVGIKTR